MEKKIKHFLKEIVIKKRDIRSLQYQLVKILKFDTKNFRINSTDWEQVIHVPNIVRGYENGQKDVREFVHSKHSSEADGQIFSWDATIRETKRMNKCIPNSQMIESFINNNWHIKKGFEEFFDNLNLMHNKYYWLSDEFSSTRAYYYSVQYGTPTVVLIRHQNKDAMLSVRCLKD